VAVLIGAGPLAAGVLLGYMLDSGEEDRTSQGLHRGHGPWTFLVDGD
jgi:hypothetical protein